MLIGSLLTTKWGLVTKSIPLNPTLQQMKHNEHEAEHLKCQRNVYLEFCKAMQKFQMILLILHKITWNLSYMAISK